MCVKVVVDGMVIENIKQFESYFKVDISKLNKDKSKTVYQYACLCQIEFDVLRDIMLCEGFNYNVRLGWWEMNPRIANSNEADLFVERIKLMLTNTAQSK